jgi:hypothetical protein
MKSISELLSDVVKGYISSTGGLHCSKKRNEVTSDITTGTVRIPYWCVVFYFLIIVKN